MALNGRCGAFGGEVGGEEVAMSPRPDIVSDHNVALYQRASLEIAFILYPTSFVAVADARFGEMIAKTMGVDGSRPPVKRMLFSWASE